MKQASYCLTIFLILLAGLVSSCQRQSKPALKVAATSIPHAEILEFVKPIVQEQGIELEIIVVEDFNTPNRALQDKEIDANFFQHLPFLEMQNKELGYSIENLAGVHLEPMALYSKTLSSLNEVKDGQAIAIPSDPTNQARALCLLEQAGLIQLNRRDSQASLFHVSANPRHFNLIEMDSPLLCRTLDDVALAAITTNFALQAGLSPNEHALAIENASSLFVNIIAIRSGESSREDLQILKQALTSENVRGFIENHYKGAVIPAF